MQPTASPSPLTGSSQFFAKQLALILLPSKISRGLWKFGFPRSLLHGTKLDGNLSIDSNVFNSIHHYIPLAREGFPIILLHCTKEQNLQLIWTRCKEHSTYYAMHRKHCKEMQLPKNWTTHWNPLVVFNDRHHHPFKWTYHHYRKPRLPRITHQHRRMRK